MFKAASYNPDASTGVPKVFNPGSHIARIVNLSLEEPNYEAGKGAYFVNVLLEGQPEDEGFEGILIDKNNTALGRYQGKIATVKSGRYPFSNFTYQGKEITRDEQMFRFIMNLVTQLGALEALQNEDIDGANIEEYFENVKPFLINRWGYFTIAGQEYFTEGYERPNYRLFFPKSKSKLHAFSAIKNEAGEVIQFLKFDPIEHIVPALKKDASAAPPVDSFAPSGSFGQPVSQPGIDLFVPSNGTSNSSMSFASNTSAMMPAGQSFAASLSVPDPGEDLKLPF